MMPCYHEPKIVVAVENVRVHKTKISTNRLVGCLMKLTVREGADKSLAGPGRKQATATKLGIYSIHPPRSSIQFLVRSSNFCKPLKKIQNFVRPIRSPRQQ